MTEPYDIKPILYELIKVSPNQEHNDTIHDIEGIFRKNGFYTTREYPIFKIKDKPERSGRIDLIARRGKLRIAIEYDHKFNVKFKSYQKIMQIKPEIAIAITGLGYLKSSVERAMKYKIDRPLYVISLKEKKYIEVRNHNFETKSFQSD